MTIIPQAKGNYSFLPAENSPYSAGAVPMSGYEVIHATLRSALPWRAGLSFVEKHLAFLGRPKQALCAIELRCPTPFTPDQWVGPGTFNADYVRALEGWDIFIDGLVPVARTNVAPIVAPPTETVLHGFSYTVPTSAAGEPTTFVVAGGAESPDVRRDETSIDALREKTAAAMDEMRRRLFALGATWDDVTHVGVYSIHDYHSYIVGEFLTKVGPAARHGLRWYYSRPPITDREMELDLRGIRQDLVV
jgi:hypothetical protein